MDRTIYAGAALASLIRVNGNTDVEMVPPGKRLADTVNKNMHRRLRVVLRAHPDTAECEIFRENV